jgi:hypothetical protein
LPPFTYIQDISQDAQSKQATEIASETFFKCYYHTQHMMNVSAPTFCGAPFATFVQHFAQRKDKP